MIKLVLDPNAHRKHQDNNHTNSYGVTRLLADTEAP
jgi:hypothetical protein